MTEVFVEQPWLCPGLLKTGGVSLMIWGESYLKYRIRETINLLLCGNSSTDTNNKEFPNPKRK